MSDLRAQMQRDLQWLCDCPDLMMAESGTGTATESGTGTGTESGTGTGTGTGTVLPSPTIPSLDDPLWGTVE
ncbi:MAG: hypothetical protein KBF76_11585, partial [Verrucomicrobiales bacterium]|nr:hypothetical protein [Verrucomicrobiales bacterium]